MSRLLPEFDKVLIALGMAVREARTNRGLTLEELAQRADLDLSYISIIERGQRNPTWGTVRMISKGLDIRLSELAHRAEELERQL
ncbi:MAG TPA: helix-turn-helix transcriptional regulator [Solirubrobacterales bacterium]|nr:helix-turn-helix transcriptional regulator [Solirubrobacterales bacterium]